MMHQQEMARDSANKIEQKVYSLCQNIEGEQCFEKTEKMRLDFSEKIKNLLNECENIETLDDLKRFFALKFQVIIAVIAIDGPIAANLKGKSFLNLTLKKIKLLLNNENFGDLQLINFLEETLKIFDKTTKAEDKSEIAQYQFALKEFYLSWKELSENENSHPINSLETILSQDDKLDINPKLIEYFDSIGYFPQSLISQQLTSFLERYLENNPQLLSSHESEIRRLARDVNFNKISISNFLLERYALPDDLSEQLKQKSFVYRLAVNFVKSNFRKEIEILKKPLKKVREICQTTSSIQMQNAIAGQLTERLNKQPCSEDIAQQLEETKELAEPFNEILDSEVSEESSVQEENVEEEINELQTSKEGLEEKVEKLETQEEDADQEALEEFVDQEVEEVEYELISNEEDEPKEVSTAYVMRPLKKEKTPEEKLTVEFKETVSSIIASLSAIRRDIDEKKAELRQSFKIGGKLIDQAQDLLNSNSEEDLATFVNTINMPVTFESLVLARADLNGLIEYTRKLKDLILEKKPDFNFEEVDSFAKLYEAYWFVYYQDIRNQQEEVINSKNKLLDSFKVLGEEVKKIKDKAEEMLEILSQIFTDDLFNKYEDEILVTIKQEIEGLEASLRLNNKTYRTMDNLLIESRNQFYTNGKEIFEEIGVLFLKYEIKPVPENSFSFEDNQFEDCLSIIRTGKEENVEELEIERPEKQRETISFGLIELDKAEISKINAIKKQIIATIKIELPSNNKKLGLRENQIIETALENAMKNYTLKQFLNQFSEEERVSLIKEIIGEFANKIEFGLISRKKKRSIIRRFQSNPSGSKLLLKFEFDGETYYQSTRNLFRSN